ncbi:hypothetical protein [Nostoc sp. LEGE 12450]|uniref:hypothetical protein n=1 Tax=Nostoc sp. LEGE 12450 TaxID=1828643 RepID=UPI00187F572F|nr:hypothetical protein [Nostoc sp. LEGE 12450]MBE8989788.1 hypothetical protein [Nostoc sp. LEGE 12450]
MSERYIELISDFADITAETLTVTGEYQVIHIKNLSLPDWFYPSTVRSSEFCSRAKLAIRASSHTVAKGLICGY